MKLLDLVFDLSAFFFRRGREIDTDDKDISGGRITASDSVYIQGGLLIIIERAEPATPPSGLGYLYEKTDGKLYFKNDAGTETPLT